MGHLPPLFTEARCLHGMVIMNIDPLRVHCTAITKRLKFYARLYIVTRVDPYTLQGKSILVPRTFYSKFASLAAARIFVGPSDTGASLPWKVITGDQYNLVHLGVLVCWSPQTNTTSASVPLHGSFRTLGPQGEILLDGLVQL